VELIRVVLLAVLGIFAAAFSRQLTDEFKAWTPWLINYLIRRAVRQLPENQRTLREEEWRSHINEIPGEFGKLFEALDFLRASWNMSPGLTDVTSYLVVKRASDIFLGATAFWLLMPLLLVSAVAIRLDSDGPVTCVVRRMGHKHNTIKLWKFRTTAIPGDGPGLTQEGHWDLRLTRVGRYLRQLGADGLPQLINVFRGEMALVGPRPLRLSEFDLIDNQLPSLSRRKNVKPGIFGWAKVNGFGEDATTLEKLQCEIEQDLYYVDNRSLLIDLKILVTGIWNIVRPRGS
jgi:lipopolysaccharide/colanic/teichoic acid biosynthesis glycosyltransferase